MRNININELQAKISQIIKAVERGENFEIIRYSEPVAVILGKEEFEALKEELAHLRASCRSCVDEFRKIKNKGN